MSRRLNFQTTYVPTTYVPTPDDLCPDDLCPDDLCPDDLISKRHKYQMLKIEYLATYASDVFLNT
jgi:hypothetical protein